MCAHVREPKGKEALLKGKDYLVNMGSGICARAWGRVEPRGVGCLQVALGEERVVRRGNQGREQSGKVRGK